eukprot:Seg705.9 transcript_id=Seg705.9/GoldUCD/mRNA.D3Y31 product="hypothetical protein" protein_id=Seg705.9/GoldUCD/D3Y31
MAGARRGKNSNAPADDESVAGIQAFFEDRFKDLESRMATKDCINNLMKTILDQNTRISQLEDKVAVLEHHIMHLEKQNDDNEQYQRRLCLRIHGIDLLQTKAESGEDCLKKFKQVFRELKVSIPDAVIDRAHRIGPSKKVNGKDTRQMIVRMTTWRHRTMIYRARKNSQKYKVRLDLKKKRMDLLNKANELLKGSENSFAFCDVNCRSCLFDDGNYKYFDNLKEFEKLLNGSKVEDADENEISENEEDGQQDEETS